MRIVMIGSGYVGLVSGACLADFGHHITCVDKSEAKIDALERGEVPIFEPGLDAIIEHNRAAGRLDFSKKLAAPVAAADAVFIAVGTPSRRGDGHADLSYVYAAAREIAAAVTGFTVVVTKSTVPVGTGDEIERIFREEFPSKDIAVVSNPEFLREGAAITDFKRPDRIVIGTEDARATEAMREVYRPLYLNEAPLYFCERRTSELIKYAANAFLAMKITFINEIADLCEQIGADVQKVAKGIGMDKRIGDKFLHAGPGYGGSCFPKDTLALVKTAQDYDSPMRLIETTVAINDNRKRAMGRKVITACGGSVRGKKIAVLGLTFKPNTDDMRDAPSITIVQALLDGGATVHAYDPEGMEASKGMLGPVIYGKDPYEIAEDSDAIVLVTEWDEFRALDFKRLKTTVKTPTIVDLRNVYSAAEVSRHGFSYFAVGKKSSANKAS
ncbi:UDPglucose 6-dehydrogenase [Rhizobium leguminosarum]|uniref:UDP-glucose 6-dehydrogenase n=1 Tax=Rhizobium leguminosarum TaxID=384 RepID=A0AAE2MRW5_RHILE|nr:MULTISPECIES: UDP-glucose/GDP-mannose dehydrogenase family protein [Rhizobium]MBB4294156.1 UDPglucose 6-dehydrogenase [Rhizobium leguminosarum]MBB4300652.1 UDPglucose 6-dehydrogenase [Rhizobium leguminosarum]MBB4312036.1 UDPglucose 6-dehydrogenase [Rhizobium leguminosarum]MBB4420994.1 UDPglucose 6-dehydrogenase [Rhizobium leguminosarum]MBB4436182.1 UDPglucose 6-dehydrogenase [Rhizobium esperanzae]